MDKSQQKNLLLIIIALDFKAVDFFFFFLLRFNLKVKKKFDEYKNEPHPRLRVNKSIKGTIFFKGLKWVPYELLVSTHGRNFSDNVKEYESNLSLTHAHAHARKERVPLSRI